MSPGEVAGATTLEVSLNIKSMALASLLAASAFASAEVFTYNIDVTGLASWDESGSANNYFTALDLGSIAPGFTDYVLIGIGWDNVGLTTVGESWRSEAAFLFNSNADDGIVLRVGSADTSPGSGVYSSGGIIDLEGVEAGLSETIGADNILNFEVFETFDDVVDEIDANFTSGTVTLQFEAQPVPEPATIAALGVGAAALIRRRRNKKA